MYDEEILEVLRNSIMIGRGLTNASTDAGLSIEDVSIKYKSDIDFKNLIDSYFLEFVKVEATIVSTMINNGRSKIALNRLSNYGDVAFVRNPILFKSRGDYYEGTVTPDNIIAISRELRVATEIATYIGMSLIDFNTLLSADLVLARIIDPLLVNK